MNYSVFDSKHHKFALKLTVSHLFQPEATHKMPMLPTLRIR